VQATGYLNTIPGFHIIIWPPRTLYHKGFRFFYDFFWYFIFYEFFFRFFHIFLYTFNHIVKWNLRIMYKGKIFMNAFPNAKSYTSVIVMF